MKLIILILGLTVNSYAQEPVKDLVSKLSKDIEILSAEMVQKFHGYCLSDRQVPACLALGKYFELKQDDISGEKYFRKACQLNSAKGCLLGGYNLERQGKESLSNDLYYLGCFQYNSAENCLARGQNYREARDWKEALNFFTLACEKGLGQGCYFASEMVSYANHNYKKTNYLLIKGCKQDHANSCYKLGMYAQNSGDMANARWGYQQACISDILEACEDFRVINNGGILDKTKQKYKKQYEEVKDKFLKFLEEKFPLGPS